MEVVRQIAKVPTDMTDKPRIPVQVFDCGELENELDNLEQDSDQEAETNNAFVQYQRRREAKMKDKQQNKLTKITDKPLNDKVIDEEKKDGDL